MRSLELSMHLVKERGSRVPTAELSPLKRDMNEENEPPCLSTTESRHRRETKALSA
jgi:hypothetical protein